jgi:hypothetical protein
MKSCCEIHFMEYMLSFILEMNYSLRSEIIVIRTSFLVKNELYLLS